MHSAKVIGRGYASKLVVKVNENQNRPHPSARCEGKNFRTHCYRNKKLILSIGTFQTDSLNTIRIRRLIFIHSVFIYPNPTVTCDVNDA
jgi:hypothetical protein